MISTSLSPLVETISALLAAHPDHPVLVALDGRCGSGKTTLAAQLARQFPQSITVHTDDFYLPPASRVANWEHSSYLCTRKSGCRKSLVSDDKACNVEYNNIFKRRRL